MSDERRLPVGSLHLQVGLVDIARAFVTAHEMLREVGERHRAGTLEFDDVRALVSDHDGAVLFRLKERSHALFRKRPGPDGDPSDEPIGAEEVFDLAVGSLFHEAMKFRENFYQHTAYGPKVTALRRSQVPGAEALVGEFERMLSGAALRIDEALEEAETLLAQTAVLFRALLREHADNGLLTRFLVEHPEQVEAVLGDPLDALLADLHGDAGAGWAHAAASYLDSGFFAEAASAYDRARDRGADAADGADGLRLYARGMQAYLDGRYREAVDDLARWLDASEPPAEARRSIAHAALSRVGQLIGPEQGRDVAARAATLAGRLAPA